MSLNGLKAPFNFHLKMQALNAHYNCIVYQHFAIQILKQTACFK